MFAANRGNKSQRKGHRPTSQHNILPLHVLIIPIKSIPRYLHQGQLSVKCPSLVSLLLSLTGTELGRAARQNVFHFAGAMRNPWNGCLMNGRE
jgi:hypothetical protein